MGIKNTYLEQFLISAVILVLTLGCSGDDPQADTSLNSLASPSFTKIISSREILAYYAVALNYNPATDGNLLTEYTNLLPTLPQNGDSAYTSTVSRMFTNLAFRMCNNSLNQEASLPSTSRVVFRFVNLDQRPDVVAGTDLEERMTAFIRLLAFRLYGQAIPQDELDQVVSFYRSQRSLVTADAAGAKDLAVQICGLLGTTPRAIMKR